MVSCIVSPLQISVSSRVNTSNTSTSIVSVSGHPRAFSEYAINKVVVSILDATGLTEVGLEILDPGSELQLYRIPLVEFTFRLTDPPRQIRVSGLANTFKLVSTATNTVSSASQPCESVTFRMNCLELLLMIATGLEIVSEVINGPDGLHS